MCAVVTGHLPQIGLSAYLYTTGGCGRGTRRCLPFIASVRAGRSFLQRPRMDEAILFLMEFVLKWELPKKQMVFWIHQELHGSDCTLNNIRNEIHELPLRASSSNGQTFLAAHIISYLVVNDCALLHVSDAIASSQRGRRRGA
ncbi:hypothetical protein EVAR_42761_1 [Eumeta japonica]|uniref:Uncharacterized protein n=1 Tax=Eumeta variegata TaxID=151549 RepID=A0A4C1WL59_EUMVA|nr:hypothetical protein EVAR_42761_1 [Eumeta japonica]